MGTSVLTNLALLRNPGFLGENQEQLSNLMSLLTLIILGYRLPCNDCQYEGDTVKVCGIRDNDTFESIKTFIKFI